jgi:hypothetical protein
MDIRPRSHVRHFTTNAQRTSHVRYRRIINGRLFYFQRTDNVTKTIYRVADSHGREIHCLTVNRAA